MVIEEINLHDVPTDEVERVVDQGVRHRAGARPVDFLKSFLGVSRPFVFASPDGSWGEFEKHFAVIVRRMVQAERERDALQRVHNFVAHGKVV